MTTLKQAPVDPLVELSDQNDQRLFTRVVKFRKCLSRTTNVLRITMRLHISEFLKIETEADSLPASVTFTTLYKRGGAKKTNI